MKKSSLFLALSAVLVVVGLTGTYFSRIPARSVRIAFPVEGGEKGRAVLFLPPKDPGSVQGKAPLVFLCPGIFYPADKFAMMALELARSGYAACALYFPTDPAFPTGSPRRNLAILKGASRFIEERFPEVDPDRKAVFGHSWGVVTALDAAQVDDSINAVVAVGLYVGGELNVKHRNLLLGKLCENP
ncbi:MAG: hypothetical protein HYU64_11460 [Armatimonadetes bacterium]|nr:hypothetical protein [Armatimonadota bacterium]